MIKSTFGMAALVLACAGAMTVLPAGNAHAADASVKCDMVYNLSAKMLSPLQVRAKRHDFFFPVNYHGTVNIIEAMASVGAVSPEITMRLSGVSKR